MNRIMDRANAWTRLLLVPALLVLVTTLAQAATIDERVGGVVMPALNQRTYVLEATVGGATNVYASNDVINVIGINSNQYLHGLSYQVVTPVTTNGGPNLVTIGLNATATNFVDALSVNAAGGQVWTDGGDAAVANFKTTTNSINMTFTGEATGTGLVMRIRALISDFNP